MTPLDPSDPSAVLNALSGAIANKQWAIVAALAVTAIVAGARRWVAPTTKLGLWLNGKLGGIVCTLVVAFGMALVVKLGAGAKLSAAMVVDAIGLALTASGGWSVVKNLTEHLDERADAKALAAGATPITVITTRIVPDRRDPSTTRIVGHPEVEAPPPAAGDPPDRIVVSGIPPSAPTPPGGTPAGGTT